MSTIKAEASIMFLLNRRMEKETKIQLLYGLMEDLGAHRCQVNDWVIQDSCNRLVPTILKMVKIIIKVIISHLTPIHGIMFPISYSLNLQHKLVSHTIMKKIIIITVSILATITSMRFRVSTRSSLNISLMHFGLQENRMPANIFLIWLLELMNSIEVLVLELSTLKECWLAMVL